MLRFVYYGAQLLTHVRSASRRQREPPFIAPCSVRNCLFRALADQLTGCAGDHKIHRRETVDFIVQHREEFEPFVEDDVPFDRHGETEQRPGPAPARGGARMYLGS